jgi:hypothetical protein
MKFIFLIVACALAPFPFPYREPKAWAAGIPREKIDISRYILFQECLIMDEGCCPIRSMSDHDNEDFEDFCDYFNAKGPH